ncbi:AAA family ATPase [Bradyrhizobium liaoningense]|uniref:AAA family ATPase n=1 Tax=Bradyrhizobium liaoningense TaxID=43992 RepID=UPI001BABE4A0|nr:AAA family ATPase [Bradyrhizobium liaoningense]MBR0945551.1 AAA family ATPase [Bradyrhizobium liaoningense]
MLAHDQVLKSFADAGFTQDAPPPDDAPPHDSIPESADGEPVIYLAPPSAAGGLGEWDAGDFVDMPSPREWLLGFLSGLLAPGATGKTALRTLQYLALATGRPLTGQHVFKRSRVLLLSLEDDDNELRRRLAAARIHHGISPDDLRGWLFCAPPKGIRFADMKDGSMARGPLEAMLRQAITERQIDLVGLDPFVKLHGMDENSNTAMNFVSELLVKLAIDLNIAVDVPHHTKKGLQTAGDADAGRGASAARDAGRLMYTLTRMSDHEGETFGIPAEERRLYVRLDSSKVNIAPPSGEATWFKLIGVRLENGTPDYPQGDEVQTVIPWHPPKTWDGISAAQLNAALDEIEAGMPNGQRFSDASSATSRAAWPVVQKHCPDRSERQCRDILRTWIRNGVITIEEYDDAVERKPRKGLRVCHGKRPS